MNEAYCKGGLRGSGFKLQIKGVNIDVRKHLYGGLSNRITEGQPQLKGKDYSLVVNGTDGQARQTGV